MKHFQNTNLNWVMSVVTYVTNKSHLKAVRLQTQIYFGTDASTNAMLTSVLTVMKLKCTNNMLV